MTRALSGRKLYFTLLLINPTLNCGFGINPINEIVGEGDIVALSRRSDDRRA